jgi:hypothetical protein
MVTIVTIIKIKKRGKNSEKKGVVACFEGGPRLATLKTVKRNARALSSVPLVSI